MKQTMLCKPTVSGELHPEGHMFAGMQSLRWAASREGPPGNDNRLFWGETRGKSYRDLHFLLHDVARGRPNGSKHALPEDAVRGRPRRETRVLPDDAARGRPSDNKHIPPENSARGRPSRESCILPDEAARGRPSDNKQTPPENSARGRPLSETWMLPDDAARGRPCCDNLGLPENVARGSPLRETRMLPDDAAHGRKHGIKEKQDNASSQRRMMCKAVIRNRILQVFLKKNGTNCQGCIYTVVGPPGPPIWRGMNVFRSRIASLKTCPFRAGMAELCLK